MAIVRRRGPLAEKDTKTIRHVGSIRLGDKVTTSSGKMRPTKGDNFRFTSPSRDAIDAIAATYGGDVIDCKIQGLTIPEWEVTVTAPSIDVTIFDGSMSQWYELYSGSVCQRRCDGVTEMKSKSDCICEREGVQLCKPTSRLYVVMPDIPGLGTWRLRTTGAIAADELSALIDNLRVNDLLPVQAKLQLVKEQSGANTFVVPRIMVEQSFNQLVAAAGDRKALSAPERKQVVPGVPEGLDVAGAALALLDCVNGVVNDVFQIESVNDINALFVAMNRLPALRDRGMTFGEVKLSDIGVLRDANLASDLITIQDLAERAEHMI